MKYEFCDSEEPLEHWGFMQVMGKRVLDLGCSYFGNEHSQSTPEFFIEQGASVVIGVDLTLESMARVNDPNIALIEMRVDNANELDALFLRFEPDVVKCDIEGAELHLFALGEGTFRMPSEYAIETHSEELFEAGLAVLRHNGYKIKLVLDLVHTGICKVIYATR